MADGNHEPESATILSGSDALVPRARLPCTSPLAVAAADEPLTWPARIFVVLLALGGLFGLASPSPLQYIISYYVALAPCLVAFALIAYRLRDPVVSKSFLLGCAFISGVPMIMLVTVVEVLIAVVGILIVLGDKANTLAEEYVEGISNLTNVADSSSPSDQMSSEQKKALGNAAQQVWQRVKDQIPLWKILAIVFIMSFLVAALTEETSKYLIGRRYRRYTNTDSGIGVRGVIACFSASALGFAGSEHIMYATGYVSQMSFLSALWASVGRALLAFPLHIGTTFWIGTRCARFSVFKEPVSFMKSILVAIFFHGSLDAMAFLGAAEETSVPFLGYIVVPVQGALVLGMILLAKRSYAQVTEAERQIIAAEDIDQKRSQSTFAV